MSDSGSDTVVVSMDCHRVAKGLPVASSLGRLANSNDSLSDLEQLKELIKEAKAAQKIYSKFSQAAVDEIFKKAAAAASVARWVLSPDSLKACAVVEILLFRI